MDNQILDNPQQPNFATAILDYDLTHPESVGRKPLIDKLTGLLKRELFDEEAEEFLHDNRDRSIGIIFLDLDDLKIINDTEGHEIGDLYLKNCAQILKTKFQGKGILGRIGGDEFIVMAPDLHENTVEELRQLAKEKGIRANFSAGLAIRDQEYPETLSELIKKADQNMYENKRQRKNNNKI